jgi:hypothetical protein
MPLEVLETVIESVDGEAMPMSYAHGSRNADELMPEIIPKSWMEVVCKRCYSRVTGLQGYSRGCAEAQQRQVNHNCNHPRYPR